MGEVLRRKPYNPHNSYAEIAIERFGYSFSDDERMEPMENYLVSRVIAWFHVRDKLTRTIRRAGEDLGYLSKSLDDPSRIAPYIPLGGYQQHYAAEAAELEELTDEIRNLAACLVDQWELIRAADDDVLTRFLEHPGEINAELRTAATVVLNPVTGAPLGTVKDEPTEASDA